MDNQCHRSPMENESLNVFQQETSTHHSTSFYITNEFATMICSKPQKHRETYFWDGIATPPKNRGKYHQDGTDDGDSLESPGFHRFLLLFEGYGSWNNTFSELASLHKQPVSGLEALTPEMEQWSKVIFCPVSSTKGEFEQHRSPRLCFPDLRPGPISRNRPGSSAVSCQRSTRRGRPLPLGDHWSWWRERCGARGVV